MKRGESIHGASVRVLGQRSGTRTNLDGEFAIQLPQSSYRIRVTHMGSETQTFDLNLKERYFTGYCPQKIAGDESIDAVTVVGNVGIKKVKESAYNVTVLDAKPTYNSSMEVTSLLNQSSRRENSSRSWTGIRLQYFFKRLYR